MLFIFWGKPSWSQELGVEVDAIIKRYVDSGFSGVAMVAKKGTVLLNKAYGYADDEKKIPNSVNTLFNVASLGKQFTAVIVMKLEEQGLLNTKDYVSKYVGKLGGLKDSATIGHLLMHTSGLFPEGAELDYSSREKYIESVRNTPLESKPGERHRYSNAGYTLLAAVVETVTGEPFEKVLVKMIFRPAGMKYTGYPWERRIRKPLLATGYNSKGEARPAEVDIWGNRGPGNLVTNSADMLRWHKAWLNDKLISPAIRERMLRDHLPGKETFSWNKVNTDAGKLFHKGGGRADFQSQALWWPEKEIFIFFSTNRDKDQRRWIYRDIVALVSKLEK
jgi:CubicO group peptidase (beta-lactamase class C family)